MSRPGERASRGRAVSAWASRASRFAPWKNAASAEAFDPDGACSTSGRQPASVRRRDASVRLATNPRRRRSRRSGSIFRNCASRRSRSARLAQVATAQSERRPVRRAIETSSAVNRGGPCAHSLKLDARTLGSDLVLRITRARETTSAGTLTETRIARQAEGQHQHAAEEGSRLDRAGSDGADDQDSEAQSGRDKREEHRQLLCRRWGRRHAPD